MVGNPVTKFVLILFVLIGFLWIVVIPSNGSAAINAPVEVQQFAPQPVMQVVPVAMREEVVVDKVPPAPSLTERYARILVRERGPAYGKSKSHSHYRSPIVMGADGLAGQSRRWGDASLEVQAEAIERMVQGLSDRGFTSEQIGFALALVRHESGFNPDAAAGYTSASGLGQFVDKTRAALAKRCGVSSSDPFCVDVNVACMSEALKEMFKFAAARAKPGTERYYSLAYAYHHDGPSLDSGGLDIAREKIAPWIGQCVQVLSSGTQH